MNRVLYQEWYPQVMYNHHQTGPAGTVMFAPPFRDPMNYNLHPLIRTGLDVREASRAIDVPEKWRDAAEAGSEVWYAGESTWWIAAEAPHEVLRYRGLLGAPGSAEVETDRSR